ncbi:MAG TPA: hypothetical protein VHU89_13410 [Acidobacteriaceae bacterium]|nr:hypothetical protein [Acidobacteriaceae bacterium]
MAIADPPAATASLRARRGFPLAFPRRLSLLASGALLVAGFAPGINAWADHPATGVVEALQRKYLVTQMTPDYEQVTKDGTTMVMKCPGIYTLPSTSIMEPDNTVLNGSIKSSSMFARMTLVKMGSHVLQTGDKVYITKIESKGSSSDELRVSILSVDPLDVAGGDAQKRYKGIVSFKFKKGYLDETPPEEVEAAIEAILAPDTGGDDAQGGDGQAQGPPAAAPPTAKAYVAAPPPPPPPPPAAPAGPPPTVSIGESSTQVLQALGMPLQMIDLGKKKTFVYKNMKVIFVDDKVSDVQ